MNTSSLPANWQHEIRGTETVLTFVVRGGKGYLPGLALGLGSALVLGYGLWVFLHGWIFNHEEVLPGSVILFVILLLALLFPLSIFNRLLYAKTFYRLTPDALIIDAKSPLGGKSRKITRSEAVYVDKVQTPAQKRWMDDTWRTLLFYGDKTRPKSLSFDGYSKEECDWLAPKISAWAAVPCRSESTVDDAD